MTSENVQPPVCETCGEPATVHYCAEHDPTVALAEIVRRGGMSTSNKVDERLERALEALEKVDSFATAAIVSRMLIGIAITSEDAATAAKAVRGQSMLSIHARSFLAKSGDESETMEDIISAYEQLGLPVPDSIKKLLKAPKGVPVGLRKSS